MGWPVSVAGKVWVSRPLGSVSPKSSEAVASAPSWPGYHISRTAAVAGSHGMRTDEPVLSTTTVLGLALATAAMSSFCRPGRDSDCRSTPSELSSCAKTTAVRALAAAATARSKSASASSGVTQVRSTDSGVSSKAQPFIFTGWVPLVRCMVVVTVPKASAPRTAGWVPTARLATPPVALKAIL